MALQFPITFELAPLSTGEELDANAYGQALVANLRAFISGQFLTGQVGGSAPTTDIGPWFNNGVWYYWDAGTSSYIPQTLTSSFPTGSVIPFGGDILPVGFLWCNGAPYLRVGTYGPLFAEIGTTWGSGDGSSTFNVPNVQGRNLVGCEPMGIGGVASGLTPHAAGSKFGTQTETLTVPNIPAHNHPVVDTHYHTYDRAVAGNIGGPYTLSASAPNAQIVETATLTSGISSGSIVTTNTGSGTAHNNIQPSVAMSAIIKY